jgi:CRP-like cAMP-binding protein
MLIQLSDMTKGMGITFIRSFMETATHTSCRKGEFIFKEGDTAHHFFTLIQGQIRLTIGTNLQNVYNVRQPGDIFGWSSLVGGNFYSATAVCVKQTDVFRFNRDKLFALLDRFPDSKGMFFKKLAEMLGKRLLESYLIIRDDKLLSHREPRFQHPVGLQ